MAALGERYRALAPDLRGHGRASDAVPVTLEAVLADLEPLVRAEPVTVVGYSMGGRIALHAALAWGERVRHLVLIGASPGIAGTAVRAARRNEDERLAQEIEASSIEDFARRWAATPVLVGLPEQARRRAHADRLRNRTPGLARALRGLGTGTLPSLWRRLPELKMPVTLVVGERDKKFTQIARRMGESLPVAALSVVEEVGHAVHLEAPARVAELIARGA